MRNNTIYKTWSEVIAALFQDTDSEWYEAVANGDEVRVFTNSRGEYIITEYDITDNNWEEVTL